MAKDIFLYWSSGSPSCWRVLLTLAEKGITDYPNKRVSFEKQEHKSEEVLKLNPRGQMPTFRHGDIVINESLAVIDYLESIYSNQGTKLIPDDPAQRALVLQRKYEALIIQKKGPEEVVHYLKHTKKEDQNEELIQQKKQALLDELKRWEGYLEQLGPDSHIARKDFSMADVVFFSLLALMVRLGFKLEPRFPRLGAYYSMVKQRPTVQATWPPHWKDTPNGELLAFF